MPSERKKDYNEIPAFASREHLDHDRKAMILKLKCLETITSKNSKLLIILHLL